MRYWIWLHDCLGYQNKRIHQILRAFSTPEKLFQSDDAEIVSSGLFTQKEVSDILERSLTRANRVLERCEQLGITVMTMQNPDYPEGLKQIAEPPAVLFCKGNTALLKQKGIAVVGTREPTLTGKKTAFEFGYYLSQHGYTIVSGAAEGVDTQAHKGALQSNGATIGVLGGGLNHRYLPKNRSLREEIARHGLLLSEYPPDMEPANYTFPRRNRIISALSECTVVIEAGMSSGSLITASTAREQGKLLFAVPGSLDSYSSSGTNALLAEGAKAAVSYTDILRRLGTPAVPQEDEEEIEKEAILRIRDEGKRLRKDVTSPVSVPVKKDRRLPSVKEGGKRKASPKKEPEERETASPTSVPVGKRSTVTVKKRQTEKRLFNMNEKSRSKAPVEEKDDNFLKSVLTENALSVYHTISETPVYIDLLKEAVHLEIGDVLSALTELELLDLIRPLPNGKYVRKS